VLDDGLICAFGEDAAEGTIVKLGRFVLAAIPLILDGAVLVCAVFGVVADDVVEDINQVDDLVGILIGDGSPVDGEGRHLG